MQKLVRSLAGLSLALNGCIDVDDDPMPPETRIGFDLSLELEHAGNAIPIVVRGSIDRVAAARRGFIINTQVGDYSTMMLSADRLTELLETFPGITVDASGPIELQSDLSVNEIEGYRMWGYSTMPPIGTQPAYPGFSGKRVLVGIVDTGIDPSHPDLRRPCRAGETPSPVHGDCSRILFVWNQSYGGHTKPAGFSYGSEYTAAAINSGSAVIAEEPAGLTFFNPPDASVGEYTAGHGTMVAGIAAGTGKGAARCTTNGTNKCDPQWKYFGLAPNADIAVVRLGNLGGGGVVDGVNWLKQKAAQLGQPLVVNLSLGTNAGPHDGSGFMDESLQLLTGPGALISASAGNFGASNNHARVSPSAGQTVSIPFTVPPQSTSLQSHYFAIEGWHDLTSSFDLQLVSPSGVTTPVVAPGATSGDLQSVNGRLWVQNDAVIDATTKAKRHYVYVRSASAGDGTPSPGLWTIKVTRRAGSTSGPLDFWLTTWSLPIDVTQPLRVPYFSGFGADATTTISSPGTADGVITTGAYTSEVKWTTYDGGTSLYAGSPVLQQVAPFSSVGPRRDGVQKPDLVAPGFGVFTTLAPSLVSTTSSIWKSVDGIHRIAYGTSLAAAHTTGALALLLEENPNLTPAEARQTLIDRARKDAFTGTSWSASYGHGKLKLGASTVGPPSPETSIVETVIVGTLRGNGLRSLAADPSGLLAAPGYQVALRDSSNRPLANRVVTLDFSGTVIRLATSQGAGTTVSCTQGTLTATTDASGTATVFPMFGKFVAAGSVHVSAGGVALRSVPARSLDIDGNGLLNTGDLSLFSQYFFQTPYLLDTDFDLSGKTALGDYTIFADAFVTASSVAVPFCR